MIDESVPCGLVTGAFSLRMEVRIETGETVTARLKGKQLRPVCGDRVRCEAIPGEPEWLITGILPRRNELRRPDSRGRREVLAANIDSVVVTAAAEPAPDWFIVDRYLAAAENMQARAVVAFNKSDLSPPPPAFDVYRRTGYPAIAMSAVSGAGIDGLADELSVGVAIIVGQSGVGKSSIINALVGDETRPIRDISARTGEGRHTTVNSVMLPLPGGGAVIDSPGVRDYAPALDDPVEVIRGFREIAEEGRHCRFANCLHLREPDCLVKAAVKSGTIDARRYESYKRLMSLTRSLGRT